MPDSSVSIRLLGPVNIQVGGAPLAVDTRKAVALLAYLAVTGRPASRESLAALLWSESSGMDARGALRRTLSVLNSGLKGRGLVIDRGAVTLQETDVDVDLRTFRAALGRARDHGHDMDLTCTGCDEWLDAALTLDRGPFMDGFGLRDSEPFDEWQTAEAEAHRRDMAAVLERLARSRLAARSWDRAAAAGRRWLDLDPLHEPAHRLLMSTYAATGEEAAAIRQYRDCVRVLDAELGVAPLEATTELYESIRWGSFQVTTRTDEIAGPSAGSVPAEAGSTEGPLVGRADALERGLSALRAIRPDGRLLVIEGEPGIGKTRLARVLVDQLAERGSTILEARAYAGESAIPYAAIAELARVGLARPDAASRLALLRPDTLAEAARLVSIPGIRPRRVEPGDPLGRSRLLEALVDLLAALVSGPAPGIIWLDDAHLADGSTLEMMAFLVRRLRMRPLGLLLSWRREDLTDPIADELAAVAVAEGGIGSIALGRLGRDDVETLALASLGPGVSAEFVDRLYAASEGLPLYVAEALAGPGDGVSGEHGGIDAMVRRRLASLTGVAHQVVSAAGVIGRSFDLETVRHASGRGEEEAVLALEELTRRGIVREGASGDGGGTVRYDFTHARLRDVVYDSLGLARRRLLHRRVAESLAAPARSREGGLRWPLIAYHEGLAGRMSEAAEAHRRAGEDARAVFANAEARGHFEAALALGHPAVGELHRALGEVLTLLGDYSAAVAHLEAAASQGEPGSLATIEHQLGKVHARRGDWDRAEAHLAAALVSVGMDDPGRRSAILADQSAVAHRCGDAGAAERAALEALGIAMGAGERTAIARAEDVLGMLARRRGDLAAARAHLERSLAATDPGTDPSLQIAAMNTLALVVADSGDRTAAIDLTREALAMCERVGDRHRQAALENNLADLLHADGRGEEAMEHLKRAVAIFSDVAGEPDEPEPEIWKLVEW